MRIFGLLMFFGLLGCAKTNKMTDTTSDIIPIFLSDLDTPANAWRVQDDVVMGGRSQGRVNIEDDGKVHFHGNVSLENNGGFSSMIYEVDPAQEADEKVAFRLLVKGDGSTYKFRVRSAAGDRFYHQAEFETNGDWETIAIPFELMTAVRRGRAVDVPNYAGETINRLQILIGNGKAETFELWLERVEII